METENREKEIVTFPVLCPYRGQGAVGATHVSNTSEKDGKVFRFYSFEPVFQDSWNVRNGECAKRSARASVIRMLKAHYDENGWPQKRTPLEI